MANTAMQYRTLCCQPKSRTQGWVMHCAELCQAPNGFTPNPRGWTAVCIRAGLLTYPCVCRLPESYWDSVAWRYGDAHTKASQQRACPGFAPDSLFIQTAERCFRTPEYDCKDNVFCRPWQPNEGFCFFISWRLSHLEHEDSSPATYGLEAMLHDAQCNGTRSPHKGKIIIQYFF